MDQIESAGCNNLIREGAILIRNAGDVVDEIMMTLDNYSGTTLKIEDKSISSTFSNDSSVEKVYLLKSWKYIICSKMDLFW